MNFYASTSGGDHNGGFSLIHPDSHHADAIVVPDAELLFTGNFHRSGSDLVLTGHDGRHHVIPGYFSSEHPPALMAPNGAHLSPDLVGLLAGSPAPHEYAQAQTQTQAAASPDSIGTVQKVVGTVSVLRNGVSVALNVGDVVYKSDVVLTGADSKCGLTFPDGTALELLPNTRMALTDYSYDPNGHSNSALFTYVTGTFGFFAGKVAHSGDMKIETPVATMGIRGTTGVMGQGTDASGNLFYWQTIYDDPHTNVSGSWDDFLRNPDGTLYVGATISQTDFMTIFTLRPGQPPLVTTIPITDSYNDIGLGIIQELTALVDLGTTPHSIGGHPGSGDNPLPVVPPNFFPENPGFGGPYTYNYQVPNPPPGPSPPQLQIPTLPPVTPPTTTNVFIWPKGNGTWPTGPDWLAGTAPAHSSDSAIIESGDVKYDLDLTIFSLTIDGPGELDVIGGGLSITNGLDVFGLLLVEGDPPIFTTYGAVTVESGGKIVSSGAGAVIDFLSADPSNPAEVDNFGTIAAKHGGDVTFLQVLITNEAANAGNTNPDLKTPAGKIVSIGCGSVVDFTQSDLDNAGRVAAKYYGEVFFVDSSVTNEKTGQIKAKHHGTITFSDTDVTNFGAILAEFAGKITFDSLVINESGGRIDSLGCESCIAFSGNKLDNSGVVGAAYFGTVKFTGETIVNEASNSSGDTIAPGGQIDATNGGLVKIDLGTVTNNPGAVIDATHHGEVELNNTYLFNDGGKVEAADCGLIVVAGCIASVTNDGGTFEAKNYSTVVFDAISGVVNEDGGKIEAEDHGTVLFEDVLVANYDQTTGQGSGLIEAIGCGASIELDDATIVGGTLRIENGSQLDIESRWGATLDGVDVVNKGTINVDRPVDTTTVPLVLDGGTTITSGTLSVGDNGLLEIEGKSGATLDGVDVDVDRYGNIEVGESIFGTFLALDEETTTFGSTLTLDGGTTIGGGTLTIENGSQLDIESSRGATLDGVDVVNKGTIDVDELRDTTTVPLVLDGGTMIAGGTLSIGDNGLLEVEGRSGAALDGVDVDVGRYGNIEIGEATTSGTSLALDEESTQSGSTLTLDGGTTISGGTLTIETDSQLDIESRWGATLDGVDVVNKGTINVDEWQDTTTVPLVLDDGTTIAGGALSIGDEGVLDIERGFNGPGATLDDVTVDVSHGGAIQVDAPVSTTTTLKLEDGTKISGGTLSIGSAGILDIERGVNGPGATLDDVTVNVSLGGLVQVDAPESTTTTLKLEDGTKISGGTLSVGSAGILDIERGVGGPGATLDDVIVNVSLGGLIQVDAPDLDTATLKLDDGTKISGGTLSIGDEGILDVESKSGATLGGVSVNVSPHGHIEIGESTVSGSILTLDDGTTITGGTLVIEGRGSELDVEASTGATLDNVTLVNDGGTINIDPGTAQLTLEGDASISGGNIVIGDHGTLNVDGGTLSGVAITDDGNITVGAGDALVLDGNDSITFGPHGTLTDSSPIEVSGHTTFHGGSVGTIDIGSDAFVELNGTMVHEVDFTGADGTLKLDQAGNVGSFAGFAAGDVIDLANLTYSSGEFAVWNQAGGALQIFEGSTLEDTIDLTGNYVQTDFALTQDGSTGTDVVYATNDDWINKSGGLWSVAANWGQDIVPDSIINAVIDLGGNYTVTTTHLVTANSLMIGDHQATLAGSGVVSIPTIDNDGTIEAWGGTLTVTSLVGITNDGTLGSGSDADLIVDGKVDNSDGLIAVDSSKADFADAVSGGNATITGGSLEFDSASSANVTFDNGKTSNDNDDDNHNHNDYNNGNGETPKYGVLVLDDAANFTGHIDGFSGTGANLSQSDAIDLAGFAASKTVLTVGVFNSTSDTTLVTVVDSHDHLSASLTFDGHWDQDDFALKSDGNGGTYIFDSPAGASATSQGSVNVDGTLTFAGDDGSSDLSAAVTPDGTNYLGNFGLSAVTESNGAASVDYAFSLDNDQINLGADQTATQSYQVSLADAQNPAANASQTVSVSIGGAGNDNFVFAPGVGADTILNFNAQQDTVHLDNFANAQTTQQLQALVTTDTHGDATIDLGNHDSITFANTTSAQLLQAIQNGHVLLH